MLVMNKKTTVDLTEEAQRIKDKFAPIYGLRNILSAGLCLFANLSRNQREDIISNVNKHEQTIASETVYILTADEQKILDSFRDKMRSPMPPKSKSG